MTNSKLIQDLRDRKPRKMGCERAATEECGTRTRPHNNMCKTCRTASQDDGTEPAVQEPIHMSSPPKNMPDLHDSRPRQWDCEIAATETCGTRTHTTCQVQRNMQDLQDSKPKQLGLRKQPLRHAVHEPVPHVKCNKNVQDLQDSEPSLTMGLRRSSH